jgi:hypothetical protein
MEKGKNKTKSLKNAQNGIIEIICHSSTTTDVSYCAPTMGGFRFSLVRPSIFDQHMKLCTCGFACGFILYCQSDCPLFSENLQLWICVVQSSKYLT